MSEQSRRRLDLPSARPQLTLAIARLRTRIWRAFSPERIVAQGTRYTALSPGSLRRALARGGPGHKDFRVRFPDGASMKVRASRTRVFADLQGPRLIADASKLAHALRPGTRLLILGGGTGYLAAWASSLIGETGFVVSLDRDATSIEFAARRYRAPNISFEQGFTDALEGELNGSFDAVLVCRSIRVDDPPDTLRKVLRVVRPGGWLLVSTPDHGGPKAEPLLDRSDAWKPDSAMLGAVMARALDPGSQSDTEPSPLGGCIVLVKKSDERRP